MQGMAERHIKHFNQDLSVLLFVNVVIVVVVCRCAPAEMLQSYNII